MNLKYILLFFCFFTLTSCSLWKAGEWNSDKVVLEVRDEFGARLSGVKILSMARSNGVTDNAGQSILFFSQSGLHVVTLQSAATLTKQIKIKVPDDSNKVVVVSLQLK